MLNLLAWLFWGWKGLLKLFPEREKEVNHSGYVIRKHVREPYCGNTQEGTTEHTYSNIPGNITKIPNVGNGVRMVSDVSHPVDAEYVYSQQQPWSSNPPSYDSLFSPGSESIEGKQGIDPCIEQLLAAASWQAVSDDPPSEGLLYKTKKPCPPKRNMVEEDDINPVNHQMSVESGSSYPDDVFAPDPVSESDLDRAGPFQSSTPISVQNRIHQFEGTERTTLFANANARQDQCIKSVSVNVSQPTGFQYEDYLNGRDDSGCLSDSFLTPKQYKSSLHTVLHSPYGSQENLSHISYELGVDKYGHRRLDSWDALNVDRHLLSSQTAPTRVNAGEEKTKMTITVRPKSSDLSPAQVIISPRSSNHKEEAKFSYLDWSGQADKEKLLVSEGCKEAVCDSSFGLAEVGEDLSIAKVCKQDSTDYSVASQSSISLRQKRTLNNTQYHESVTTGMGGGHTKLKHTPVNIPNRVPLVDKNEDVPENAEKIPRRPTFDSDSYSQLELFYTELDKGMEFGSPPAASYREFDEIMNKRRRHVDVIDNAGSMFGIFGSRESKLTGVADSKAKKCWRKVRFAVLSGQYKQF